MKSPVVVAILIVAACVVVMIRMAFAQQQPFVEYPWTLDRQTELERILDHNVPPDYSNVIRQVFYQWEIQAAQKKVVENAVHLKDVFDRCELRNDHEACKEAAELSAKKP